MAAAKVTVEKTTWKAKEVRDHVESVSAGQGLTPLELKVLRAEMRREIKYDKTKKMTIDGAWNKRLALKQGGSK